MNAWVPGPDCPLSDPCPDPALRLAWNCAGCLVRRRTWLPHVKARKNKQKTQQDKTINKTQNQQTAKDSPNKFRLGSRLEALVLLLP